MMVQYASTTDSVTIKGVYWVDTVVTGAIYDGVANSITATLKDVDNDTVTTFDGDFTVTAQDDNGLIVQVSADGSTYTDSIDVSATSGAYTGDVYFELPVDVATPIAVRFQVASADAINEYQPYGVDSVESGVISFEFTSSPVGIERATNFTLTVEIQNSEGDVITDASPICSLVLSGAHASDVLSKTTIASGEWSSGVWTSTTMQITGGTGSLSDVTITITDDASSITHDVATFAILDVTGTETFELTGMRGSNPFNLVATAKSGGITKTDYVPTGDVNILAFVNHDETAVIIPVTTGSSGWVNGSKTISCSITGWTKGVCYLYVIDSDGRTGHTSLLKSWPY